MARSKHKNKKSVSVSELKRPRPNDSLQAVLDDYLDYYLWCWGDLNQFKTIRDCICGKVQNPELLKKYNKLYLRGHHQRRIKNQAFHIAELKIKKNLENLAKAVDFDQLHKKVLKLRTPGFGELCKYDFCIHFGYKMGLKPDKFLYLHAGTRTGFNHLKRLFPVLDNPQYLNQIPTEILPEEINCLWNGDLAGVGTMHVENFLCIFKERLSSLK